MIDYLLRGMVYAQCFIWILLLDVEIDWVDRFFEYIFPLFFLSGFIAMGYVHMNQISLDFYSTRLINTYVIFVLFTSFCMGLKYNKRVSICLGFLLVFVNSFFWEFMLHLNTFVFNLEIANVLVQSLHLIPVPFLMRSFWFENRKEIKKLLVKGFIVGTINIMVLNLLPRGRSLMWVHSLVYNNFNRAYCLSILITIFIFFAEKKRKGGYRFNPEFFKPFLDNKSH